MTLVCVAVRWSIYERPVFVDENFILIYVLWKIEIWCLLSQEELQWMAWKKLLGFEK